MTDPISIRRISLWGGPGSGKSTLASIVFAHLKMAGYSVELVNEYIKCWAYEKRQVGSFDQVYIFAKQLRLEDRVLRAGVKMVVTDSPLLMQTVYARKYNFTGWQELLSIGRKFDALHPAINFLLNRKHGEYQTEGRWQTVDEAKALDVEIEGFLQEFGIPYERIDNDPQLIAARLQTILNFERTVE